MRYIGAAAILTAGATSAMAGGIERTAQSAQVLFEKGNYAELSFSVSDPSVDGDSLPLGPFPSLPIGNVASGFSSPAAALKFNLSDALDVALIFDKPFGADIEYQDNPILEGTYAEANADTLTALAKYKFNDNVSVFGGLRHQRASGEIGLGGVAYGGLSGYVVELDADNAWGYVLGAAYEIPDIAFRVALTYNSEIEHNMGTTETVPGFGVTTSKTKVKTPKSLNLEVQSGLDENTLLFGSVRYVEHSAFRVDPETLDLVASTGLVELDDTITYRIGIGRKLTDRLSGLLSFAYEPSVGDDLVSPLAPTNGYRQVTVGLSYKATDNLEISGGISHFVLGGSQPETGTPDTARAKFNDNSNLAVGMKVGFRF